METRVCLSESMSFYLCLFNKKDKLSTNMFHTSICMMEGAWRKLVSNSQIPCFPDLVCPMEQFRRELILFPPPSIDLEGTHLFLRIYVAQSMICSKNGFQNGLGHSITHSSLSM